MDGIRKLSSILVHHPEHDRSNQFYWSYNNNMSITSYDDRTGHNDLDEHETMNPDDHHHHHNDNKKKNSISCDKEITISSSQLTTPTSCSNETRSVNEECDIEEDCSLESFEQCQSYREDITSAAELSILASVSENLITEITNTNESSMISKNTIIIPPSKENISNPEIIRNDTSSSALINELYECTMKVLNHINSSSIVLPPMSILVKYYLDAKISNKYMKDECFVEKSYQYRPNIPLLWNVTFYCPILLQQKELQQKMITDCNNNMIIKDQTTLLSSTSLPTLLFLILQQCCTLTDDQNNELLNATNIMIGGNTTIWKIYNNEIYASTKKIAKKLCAISCIITLLFNNNNRDNDDNNSRIRYDELKHYLLKDSADTIHPFIQYIFASTDSMVIQLLNHFLLEKEIRVIKSDLLPKTTNDGREVSNHTPLLTNIIDTTKLVITSLHENNSKLVDNKSTSFTNDTSIKMMINNDTIKVASVTKSTTKYFPKWVERIYKMGITEIEISYSENIMSTPTSLIECEHQQVIIPPSLTIDYSTDWNSSYVCCTIRIKKPIRLCENVISIPMETKHDAKLNAIRILEEKLKHKIEKYLKANNNIQMKKDIKDMNSIKQKILSYDSKYTTFYYPLSTWSTKPFEFKRSPSSFSKKNHHQEKSSLTLNVVHTSLSERYNSGNEFIRQTQNNDYYYLYELNIHDQAGNLYINQSLNIDTSIRTRIGILFPQDIDPYRNVNEFDYISSLNNNSSFCTQFILPGTDSYSNKTLIVTLTNRTRINPDQITTNQRNYIQNHDDAISYLKKFNRQLMKYKKLKADYLITRSKLNPWMGKLFGFNGSSLCHPNAEEEIDNSFGRTYLFVPLKNDVRRDDDDDDGNQNDDVHSLTIDWENVFQEVHSIKMKFLVTPYCSYTIPPIGDIDSRYISFFLLLLSVAVMPSSFYSYLLLHQDYSVIKVEQMFDSWIFSMILFIISMIILLLPLLPPKQHLTLKQMQNCFILQQMQTNCFINENRQHLYVVTSNNQVESNQNLSKNDRQISSNSEFPETMIDGKIYRLYTSYRDFYYRRHHTEIKYPKQPLLEAQSVRGNNYDDTSVHLIPEFCYVLPIRRDFFNLMLIVDKFMPSLEREINKKILTGSLVKHMLLERNETCSKTLSLVVTSLLPYMNESATIQPTPSYQRLEFLGDAVLSYYLCINTAIQNSLLEWDADDIGEIIEKACRNSTLLPASFRLGLPRLLDACKLSWKSAYNDVVCKITCSSTEISDSVLSDVFESFLAAAYLAMNKMDGSCRKNQQNLIIDSLNIVQLPFSSSFKAPKPWFKPVDDCLWNGYPFDTDPSWTNQFSTLARIIASHNDLNDKLNRCSSNLQKFLDCKHCVYGDGEYDALSATRKHTLLCCALFDDPLDHDRFHGENPTIDDVVNESIGTSQLTSLAQMRDTLYHVGVWGLKLCLTKECYTRYPKAQPTDLTLIFFASLADDVIAYIMLKHDIHRFLYTHESNSHQQLQQRIAVAEIRGQEVWDENNGWILGIEEYRKRICAIGSNDVPQYPGLCGGRFYGMENKLPIEITEDLMFAFKAIMGAYILSTGLERTWNSIFLPYFEELLVLSPHEMRRLYSSSSSLVRNY